jgi:predicted phage terminase large subunit-like protein
MTSAKPLSPAAARAAKLLRENPEAREELKRLLTKELCLKSLKDFVIHGWHVVEPSTRMIPNWHVDVICEHLEAVTAGQIQRLVINIPPGHMKSLLVSVFWPAWVLLKNPSWRSLFSSYAGELAIRDSVKCRALIASDWYRTTFEPSWGLADDQNLKTFFQTTKMGGRMALSVGGKVTGFRGDAIVVDDPLNATDAPSKHIRDSTIEWWDKAMSSRLNDMRTGVKVIIMQRLHEEDLTGHVLEKGGYEHLCLPSEFDPKRRSVTHISKVDQVGNVVKVKFWEDERKKEGDLLFPTMFPKHVLVQAKIDLGSDGFAGQHQQSPSPAEGLIFKRHWWKYWRPENERAIPGLDAEPLPAMFDQMLISADLAFKGGDGADRVAIGVIGRKGAKRYLLYVSANRLTFTETLRELRRICALYPKASLKLIEDKANGPAVVDTLGAEIAGIVAVNPEGGKESRAASTSPSVEAGNWYLPQGAAWVEGFVEELANFPKGKNDDQVDMLTQAAVYLNASPDAMRFGMLATK